MVVAPLDFKKIGEILRATGETPNETLLRDKFHPDLRRLHRFTMDDGRSRFSNYVKYAIPRT
jgi:hypothetical protein